MLVVEDEPHIRAVLRRYLQRAGLDVATAATGSAALRAIEDADPDIVLLDLGLPDIDGMEVLAAATPQLPVVVLTAHAGVEDRIRGLRSGAADYVAKPFSPTEVVLRVQAVLGRDRLPDDARLGNRYGGGLLRIDAESHEVHCRGCEVQLTPSEWTLLAVLSSHPHRVYSRYALVERLTGFAYEGYERAIDSHVKNLRRKLGDGDHSIVQTVTGFGYRFGLNRDD